MDNRLSYGSTADTISQMSDSNTLQGLLRDPQYAGFANVIIARLADIQKTRAAAVQPPPAQPPVASQVIQQTAVPPAPAPAAYAKGGIIAFRQGGKVQKFAAGGAPQFSVDDIPDNTVAADPNVQPSVPATIAPGYAAPAVIPVGVTYPNGGQPSGWSLGAIQQALAADPSGGGGGSRSAAVHVSGGGGGLLPAPVLPSAPNIQDVPTIAQTYGTIQGLLGPDTGSQQTQAAINKLQEGNDLQAARSPWMALMNFGAGIMQQAATNPRAGILGNIGAAAQPALQGYQQQQDQIDRQNQALMGTQAMLGAQQRADQVRAATTAVATNAQLQQQNMQAQQQAYNTQVNATEDAYRARQSAQAMMAQAGIYANAGGGGAAGVSQQYYATALNTARAQAQYDQAHNLPLKSPGDYLAQAIQQVVPSSLNAVTNSGTRFDIATDANYGKYSTARTAQGLPVLDEATWAAGLPSAGGIGQLPLQRTR